MDDRILKLIDDGARSGAEDVYEKYDEYLDAVKSAETECEEEISKLKANCEETIRELNNAYSSAIALHKIAEDVKNGIINKLGNK